MIRRGSHLKIRRKDPKNSLSETDKLDHFGYLSHQPMARSFVMSKYILAIDQGTTGSTASLLNQKGDSVFKVNEEFEQIYPKAGWVEHNPEAIWKSCLSTISKAIEGAKIQGSDIAAIGITNQRETVVVWDKNSGRPVHNAIVWQCRRTTDFCESLKKKKLSKMIKAKTGLVIDPYFSASKIRWILKNQSSLLSQAKAGKVLAGTIDSFLLWRLTKGLAHKTDVSNASRTMLMNIHKGDWDQDLLKLFSVPRAMLPSIEDSSGILGHTSGVPGLPDGIPISGMAGDQQSALFGQTCFEVGSAKCTFGTGSFILMNCGPKAVQSKAGVLTTVAWRLAKQKQMTYALEGGAFICGAAVQFLRDQFGFLKSSGEVEALAAQVDSSDGVEFVPALTGLGAPYWKPEARGIITGLTRGTKRAHIARATLEAMALQNVDILEAMKKDLGKNIRGLKVDGGASANNLLMQLQSDYLAASITRPKMIETTSAGAAYLAGLGVGFWKDQAEIKKVWAIDKEFSPTLSAAQRSKRLKSWHKAIAMLS